MFLLQKTHWKSAKSDAENKSNTKGRPEEGSPCWGCPMEEGELERRRRRQLEGLEAAGRLLGSSLTQMLAKMAVEAGSSKTST